MLNDKQWAAITDSFHKVCNRETDYERIEDNGQIVAVVERRDFPREGYSSIVVRVEDTGRGRWDLEPVDAESEHAQ